MVHPIAGAVEEERHSLPSGPEAVREVRHIDRAADQEERRSLDSAAGKESHPAAGSIAAGAGAAGSILDSSEVVADRRVAVEEDIRLAAGGRASLLYRSVACWWAKLCGRGVLGTYAVAGNPGQVAEGLGCSMTWCVVCCARGRDDANMQTRPTKCGRRRQRGCDVEGRDRRRNMRRQLMSCGSVGGGW